MPQKYKFEVIVDPSDEALTARLVANTDWSWRLVYPEGNSLVPERSDWPIWDTPPGAAALVVVKPDGATAQYIDLRPDFRPVYFRISQPGVQLRANPRWLERHDVESLRLMDVQVWGRARIVETDGARSIDGRYWATVGGTFGGAPPAAVEAWAVKQCLGVG